MPFRSPYRGEESLLPGLSSGLRKWISRITLLLVGLTLIYFSTRALFSMYELHAANPPVTYMNGFRRRFNVAPWLAWLVVIVADLIGATAVAGALIPVRTMQALFERWSSPPVTGDRGLHDHSWRPFGWGWWPW